MYLLTIFVIATLSFFTTTDNNKTDYFNMGMSYFIVPNKHTACQDDFGNGLSFFFEQVGGYGDKAEVEQVSKVLNIDLSVFQDVEYDIEDKKEAEKHWHDIDTFTAIVDTFIAKIKAEPDYYRKVIHNPDRRKHDDEMSKIIYMQDTAKAARLLEDLQKQPFYYYPADYGYLSEGRILKDLETLRKTLDCYKKNGVTKVRLEYI